MPAPVATAPRMPNTTVLVRKDESGLAVSYPHSVSGSSLSADASERTNPIPPKAPTRRHGTSLSAIFETSTPSMARIVTKRPKVATWPAASFLDRRRS